MSLLFLRFIDVSVDWHHLGHTKSQNLSPSCPNLSSSVVLSCLRATLRRVTRRTLSIERNHARTQYAVGLPYDIGNSSGHEQSVFIERIDLLVVDRVFTNGQESAERNKIM